MRAELDPYHRRLIVVGDLRRALVRALGTLVRRTLGIVLALGIAGALLGAVAWLAWRMFRLLGGET